MSIRTARNEVFIAAEALADSCAQLLVVTYGIVGPLSNDVADALGDYEDAVLALELEKNTAGMSNMLGSVDNISGKIVPFPKDDL